MNSKKRKGQKEEEGTARRGWDKKKEADGISRRGGEMHSKKRKGQ